MSDFVQINVRRPIYKKLRRLAIWVGMSGSPSTYAASFQTRILKNSFISKSTSVRKKIIKPTKGGKVGLGGYIFNDNNGIMKRTGMLLAYSYHIPLGQDRRDS